MTAHAKERLEILTLGLARARKTPRIPSRWDHARHTNVGRTNIFKEEKQVERHVTETRGLRR